MSIPNPTHVAALSLREIAARAWERQQDDVAARKRLEIERAREQLIADACAAIDRAFVRRDTNPGQEIHWQAAGEATYTILSTDDLLGSMDAVVGIDFLGERFEWRSEQGDPHQLIHIWTCSTCGEQWMPPTMSNVVNSLSDLGAWLAYAPTAHRCEARP